MNKKADITLDIDKGDTLLGGKFKNSPLTVEEFGTDENGQPTVNDKKLLAMRIKKQMPGQGSPGMERVTDGGNVSTEAPAGSAASVFKKADWWDTTKEIGHKAIDFFAQKPRSQGILPTEAGIYAPDEADKLKEKYTETAPDEGSFFKPGKKGGSAMEMFGKYASVDCNGNLCSIESSGSLPDILPSDADFQVPFDANGEPVAVPVNGVYKGVNMNIRRNTMDERTKNAVKKAGELMGIVKMLTGKEANMADVFKKQEPDMSFNPEEGDEVARIADKAYKDNHEVTYDWDKPVNPPKKHFSANLPAIDVISKKAGMKETILNILKSQAVPLGIGGGVFATLYGLNKLQEGKGIEVSGNQPQMGKQSAISVIMSH